MSWNDPIHKTAQPAIAQIPTPPTISTNGKGDHAPPKAKDDDELFPIFVHSLIDDMDLSPNAFRVYGHLRRRRNEVDGYAWPSYQEIGDHCFAKPHEKPLYDSAEWRRRKAIDAVKELVTAGLIIKTAQFTAKGDPTSNAYRLATINELLGVVSPHSLPSESTLTTVVSPHSPKGNQLKGNQLKGNPKATAINPPPEQSMIGEGGGGAGSQQEKSEKSKRPKPQPPPSVNKVNPPTRYASEPPETIAMRKVASELIEDQGFSDPLVFVKERTAGELPRLQDFLFLSAIRFPIDENPKCYDPEEYKRRERRAKAYPAGNPFNGGHSRPALIISWLRKGTGPDLATADAQELDAMNRAELARIVEDAA